MQSYIVCNSPNFKSIDQEIQTNQYKKMTIQVRSHLSKSNIQNIHNKWSNHVHHLQVERSQTAIGTYRYIIYNELDFWIPLILV